MPKSIPCYHPDCEGIMVKADNGWACTTCGAWVSSIEMGLLAAIDMIMSGTGSPIVM